MTSQESQLEQLINKQITQITQIITDSGKEAFAPQAFINEFQQYQLPLKPLANSVAAQLIIARNEDRSEVAAHVAKTKSQKPQIVTVPVITEETRDYYRDHNIQFIDELSPFYLHQTYDPSVAELKLPRRYLFNPDKAAQYTLQFLKTSGMTAKNIVACGPRAQHILEEIDPTDSSDYTHMLIFERECDLMPLILTGQSWAEQLSLHGLPVPSNSLTLKSRHVNAEEIDALVKAEKLAVAAMDPGTSLEGPMSVVTQRVKDKLEFQKQFEALLAFSKAKVQVVKLRTYHYCEMYTIKREIISKQQKPEYITNVLVSGAYTLTQAWQIAALYAVYSQQPVISTMKQLLIALYGDSGELAAQSLDQFDPRNEQQKRRMDALKYYQCVNTDGEPKTTGVYAQYGYYCPVLFKMVQYLQQNEVDRIRKDPLQTTVKLAPDTAEKAPADKILVVIIGAGTHAEVSALELLRGENVVDVVVGALVDGEKSAGLE